jgi:hypothetical protein
MNTGKDLTIWLTNNTILLSQSLIAIGLGYSNSYFVRGQAWLQKQNYEQAIADLTQANRETLVAEMAPTVLA